MQKNISRPALAGSSSVRDGAVNTQIISGKAKSKDSLSVLKPASVSNDNSRSTPVLSSEQKATPRPKVYISPMTAAAKNQARNKNATRFSAIPIPSDQQPEVKRAPLKPVFQESKPAPQFTSTKADAESSDEEIAREIAAVAAKNASKPGLFFDIKFALGLIAIVVAVNMLLALLVNNPDHKNAAQTAAAPAAAKPAVAAATPVPAKSAPLEAAKIAPQPPQAQGAVVTASSLSDIQPSAGRVLPPALPAAPARPAAQPALGLVTTEADEKEAASKVASKQQPARSLLGIIDRY